MLFVVRLHYANHIYHIMQHDGGDPFLFNFDNYQELKLVLTELKNDLTNMIFVKKFKWSVQLPRAPQP